MEKEKTENADRELTPEQPRDVALSFSKEPSAQLNPGEFFALRVRAVCQEMPRLEGLMVHLVDHRGQLIRKLRLMVPYPKHCDTDQIALQAPDEAGDYVWTAVFPEQKLQNITYRETRAELKFTVLKTHPVTVSVWNLSDAIVSGTAFTPRVGAKCSAGCNLAGYPVRILDRNGVELSRAALGDDPAGVSGTLYWADVPLTAGDAGSYTYRAECMIPQGDALHCAKTCDFSFRVLKRPEFRVTVFIHAEQTGLPVENAAVALYPCKAATDREGKAELFVAKGKYRLIVSGQDIYDTHGEDVWITEDTVLHIAMKNTPPPIDDAG